MPHYIFPQSTPHDCGMYDFVRTVTVREQTAVTVRIFAMTRYILTLNGEYVGEGPCRAVPETGYYDEYTVTLRAGENVFHAEIMHIGLNAFGTPLRFTTVERSMCPKLLFEAVGKDFLLESDGQWKIYFRPEHKLVYNHPQIGFIAPWETVNTAAESIEIPTSVHPSELSFDIDKNKGCGFSDSPHLSPRPIPPIKPQEKIIPKAVKQGDGFVEYDFGEYMTAKVTAELSGKGGVKLIYAECYEFPDGKHKRDDTNGTLSGGYDTVLFDGKAMFQTFWFRSFRYIRVECDCPEKTVSALYAEPCHYPLTLDGRFSCSDENYNRMYEVSIRTLLCCLHEIFVDCPYYEQQQYVMDGAVEASILMRLSDDLRPVKKLIDELAASQRSDGLLCANYPATYHQIIPGFSFFWIFLLKDYYERTGDTDMIRKHLSTADKIFTHFDEELRRKGLIGHSIYWDYADWVDGWNFGVPPTDEDDAITLYNLYYIAALNDAAFLCEKVGRAALASEYAERSRKHTETVRTRCYDAEKGLLRDGAESGSFSAHNAVWGILSGVLTGDEADAACKKMFSEELSQCSFSMNYYVFRALEKGGRYDLAYRHVLPNWQVMLDNHCTTWCESTSLPRSECHAWSSAPLYEFCTHVLGVRVEDGKLTICPEIASLSFANGTVPTRYGKVSVDWKIENGRFSLAADLPDGISATVTLPDGSRNEINGRAVFSCRVKG